MPAPAHTDAQVQAPLAGVSSSSSSGHLVPLAGHRQAQAVASVSATFAGWSSFAKSADIAAASAAQAVDVATQ